MTNAKAIEETASLLAVRARSLAVLASYGCTDAEVASRMADLDVHLATIFGEREPESAWLALASAVSGSVYLLCNTASAMRSPAARTYFLQVLRTVEQQIHAAWAMMDAKGQPAPEAPARAAPPPKRRRRRRR